MSDDIRKVVVAFGDRSLGGVSRSALSAGKIWAALGLKVTFLPFLPIHEGRLSRFEAVGRVEVDPSVIDWAATSLVHLHHAAMSTATRSSIDSLMRHANVDDAPPLMTKNVFAVDDSVLDAWKGSLITTVPGRWAAMQYANNKGRRLTRANPWIVPNVQDSDFFRPPTAEERRRVREELGLADRFTVLRIGSPLFAKWSRSYVELTRVVERHHAELIVLGAPKGLLTAVADSPVLRTLPPTSSDVELRNLYWAADKFALDSSRGETFGNVAFEAMLSGLPVSYRARPYRDNTLWELRDLDGFDYCASEKRWLESSLRPDEVTDSSRAELLDRYGYASVTRTYRSILEAAVTCSGSERLWSPLARWHSQLSLVDRMRSAVRHNPLTSRLKEVRLSINGR